MFTGKFSLRSLGSTVILIALLVCAVPAQAYFAPGDGQAAKLVLGQMNFSSAGPAAGPGGLNGPQGVAVDPATHKIFVSDYYNNRVLRYASLQALSNGAAAEAVLGQPNFTSTMPAATRAGMDWPAGLFVDTSGRLWVADWSNHRVLRFDGAAHLASGANASAVLGQPNFTSHTNHTTRNGMDNPSGVFFDNGGRLWVVDYQNSRILRFDNAAAKANGANADGVLGQPNFTTSGMGTTQHVTCYPAGIFVDAAGRLWVADQYNLRVLRFDNAASKPNGANADGVLGQPNFTSLASNTTRDGMSYPTGVTVDNASGRLFVADYGNNRILVFDAAATLPNGANASSVLGQPDFINGAANGGGLSAATLSSPYGVFFDAFDKVLLAADTANNRVLMVGSLSNSFSARSTGADDGWVLESAEHSGLGGSENAAGMLVLGDNAANKQYHSLLSFDTSSLPDNAIILSVTLRIKKAGVVGMDPYGKFGNLLADMRSGDFDAPTLETTDFQSPASANNVCHLPPVASQPGWYQLVVPAADYGLVNLMGETQFRLRFALDDNNNHAANYDKFFAGDAATNGYRPMLSIGYALP